MRLHNVRRRWWCQAVADSGAPAALSPHELRHTAASMAISAGASIKAVQKMLGHKSATLTLDRYGHLYADELQSVADRLDSLHAHCTRQKSVPKMCPRGCMWCASHPSVSR
jgi:site-specific recombinase XerD